MARRSWRSDRFSNHEDGFDPLTNLVDVMLVFAVGLMAALVAVKGAHTNQAAPFDQGARVERARDLPNMPEGLNQNSGSGGYESVGQVYRDPKTGKLYLVDKPQK